jgi:sugar phosphate isomerase/epimerase
MFTTASSLGCSTISFRRLPLEEALATIDGLGFQEIDLGALPGVCDHVPFPLDGATVAAIADVVASSGLSVRTVNADPGDLNGPGNDLAARSDDLHAVCRLAGVLGARAVVLPCGRQDIAAARSLDEDLDEVVAGLMHAAAVARAEGLRLLVEAPHSKRLCWNLDRTRLLLDRLPASIAGLVLDVSHIQSVGEDPVAWVHEVASRVEHVHLRDARPGDINVSIGRGDVDFAAVLGALADERYAGSISLELETHDVGEDEREAAAAAARDLIGQLDYSPSRRRAR